MTAAALGRFVAPVLDRLLGRGRHAVTVPPMDGALQPNNRLEEAPVLARLDALDDIAFSGGKLWVSNGRDLLTLDVNSGALAQFAHLGADICAMAAMPGEGLAVALADGTVRFLGGRLDGVSVGRTFNCITSILAIDEDTLAVTEGSSQHRCAEWRRDLLAGGRSGSIWLAQAAGGTRQIVSGLAWPAGLARDTAGVLVVSESWAHRLRRVSAEGGLQTVLDDLPGYPGRLSPAEGGGWWLSIFAPRSQLVEFVLREPEFRDRMLDEIAPEHWVAPALASGRDFREPLQGGAIKSMGILKPWAPTRSYGLVCKLDANFQPVWSAHSRADGRMHGVTATLEVRGRLHVCSRGGGAVLAMRAE
jgi:hypothetical protein